MAQPWHERPCVVPADAPPLGENADLSGDRAATAVRPPRPLPLTRKTYMEAERINLIGTTLADLTQRCAELRRYL